MTKHKTQLVISVSTSLLAFEVATLFSILPDGVKTTPLKLGILALAVSIPCLISCLAICHATFDTKKAFDRLAVLFTVGTVSAGFWLGTVIYSLNILAGIVFAATFIVVSFLLDPLIEDDPPKGKK